ncbi:hypothetical protein CPB86DRAFT_878391 [Serendipita vermifera]|nr:hypothetical protein CPB86DRAFT_878391 [Serendipita vermifera]
MTMQIRLWLHLADEWIPTLSIPRYHFALHTTQPLKWLRYLGFVIYGREGILRTTRDGPEISDYMTTDVDELLSDYFYYSPDGHRVVDTHMMDDRTSLHSLDSLSSDSSFDFEIVERDKACVVTGMRSAACHVVHLVPHAKGDDYISALTRLRGLSERDVIEDIDDLRNGMFILSPLHALLRDGQLAFLKTPNFAMNPEDVPIAHKLLPTRIDNKHLHHSSRWTMQYFSDTEGAFQMQHYLNVPHNTDLLAPEDLTDWPADFLFDMLYGCVALKRWGQEESIQTLVKFASDLDNEERLLPGSGLEDDHRKEWQSELNTHETNSKIQRDQPTCNQDVQEKVLAWLDT